MMQPYYRYLYLFLQLPRLLLMHTIRHFLDTLFFTKETLMLTFI